MTVHTYLYLLVINERIDDKLYDMWIVHVALVSELTYNEW